MGTHVSPRLTADRVRPLTIHRISVSQDQETIPQEIVSLSAVYGKFLTDKKTIQKQASEGVKRTVERGKWTVGAGFTA